MQIPEPRSSEGGSSFHFPFSSFHSCPWVGEFSFQFPFSRAASAARYQGARRSFQFPVSSGLPARWKVCNWEIEEGRLQIPEWRNEKSIYRKLLITISAWNVGFSIPRVSVFSYDDRRSAAAGTPNGPMEQDTPQQQHHLRPGSPLTASGHTYISSRTRGQHTVHTICARTATW